MNDILQLKGTFEQIPNEATPGGRNIPKNASAVTSKDIQSVLDDLKRLRDYWGKENVLQDCLIDAYYTGVVAKSNRIQGFLCTSGSVNNYVVGARFTGTGNEKRKHVITYYVSRKVINSSISRAERCIKFLDEKLGGSINHDGINNLPKDKKYFSDYGLSRSSFCHVIADTHRLEGFRVPDNSARAKNESIITIYKTDDVELVDLMQQLGIHVQPGNVLNQTTLFLLPDQISKLASKAPYLIAMETEDLSDLSYDDIVKDTKNQVAATIPVPGNEPVVGVIDTMFDESAYFADWVTFKRMISDEIELETKDFDHGTAVASIIVDGPTINPELDDGCGRFRVRHFGVMKHGPYSSFSVMKSIQDIIDQNPDIKVWNLSLGSGREVNENFISPEAAILDQIQSEKDVIFVIAGTNKQSNDPEKVERIGSPADSINGIVVNSVKRSGEPATYTRRGNVLSFFNKPDVSSYGGDDGELIRVSTPFEGFKSGTSYAAPWVTRKVAYLIEVLGLSREVAKALIIDSASGWENTGNNHSLAPLIGHGIVPTRIEDVLRTEEDEIKFVIDEVSEEWNTFAYNLPVPVDNGKHPFAAKATLCYFPSCSINQGVDYTNTELDFYVGRFDGKVIKSINKNAQNLKDGKKHYIYEEDARRAYRKWDNTKHISDIHPERVQAKAAFGSGMWGISVKTTERLTTPYGKNLKFGVVVTLKDIDGTNRLNEFMRMCRFQGWLVNRLDVENRIDIYNKAQEAIDFDR